MRIKNLALANKSIFSSPTSKKILQKTGSCLSGMGMVAVFITSYIIGALIGRYIVSLIFPKKEYKTPNIYYRRPIDLSPKEIPLEGMQKIEK